MTPSRMVRWMTGPMGMIYFWIAVGSGLGGGARLLCADLAALAFGAGFPWGILSINAIGSFAIGFFFTFTGRDGHLAVSATVRQFVMTGLCGGYTTFSTFSLDTLDLMRDGRMLAASANAILSVVACLLAAWLGHLLAARLSSRWRRIGSPGPGVSGT